ncbi:tRNA (cytidine(34)-2'-O)-methyltransferase [Phytoactinopolyspora halotolerans]|uniref:Putative tRNA (cytidine(34)-2'-O)-methyltransferase n=1 Tax=Phytoactinopolyspora halotolerans TaxID=1981512 RepID=A0A6L9S694_9ACTN|nr:tRNA (cytidine(34)-2'-O)-methyltransferase [Phytoactinopolyspora halotolerans]
MFNIVFFEPRIPPNTGNAIRMVAATGAHLHLIEPLGFELDDAKLRRAGLDYHDLANVSVHSDLAAAWKVLLHDGAPKVYAFTTGGSVRFTDIAYEPGDVLLFGPEPEGLPPEVIADPAVTAQVRIPMLAGRRSLNLSNSAAVAAYEAWRQHDFAGT